MYCINCGKKVENNNKFCVSCGNEININSADNSVEKNGYSGIKITSIVLGSLSIIGSLLVIFSPIALLISIIGLVFALCALKKEKNLLGILLNVGGLILSVIMCVVMFMFFRFVISNVGVAGNYVDDIFNSLYEEYNQEYGIEKEDNGFKF